MAASSRLSIKIFALCFVAALTISSSPPRAAASGDHGHQQRQLLGWIPSRSCCWETIADCLAGDEEFRLDSEVSRRILATSRYISYDALVRDRVPCSRRGASYYNCRAGAQANPYSRGCSAITRCRS